MTQEIAGGVLLGLAMAILAQEPAVPESIIEQLIQVRPEFYKVVELDMATARTDKEFIYRGSFIWVDNQYTTSLKATIRLNEPEFDELDLLRQKYIRGPFYRFFITNTAGAGTIKLIISRGYEFASESIEGVVRLRGEDGSPLKIDQDGTITALMKGMYSGELKTVATDIDGRMRALLYGMYGSVPRAVAVDEEGRIAVSSISQSDVTGDTTEAQTWDTPIGTLVNNLNRLRYAIIQATGEAWGTVSHSIATIWAKFHETTGHKHTGDSGDAPTISHTTLADVSADQHHTEVHSHTHASLSGVTADQHHTQSHDHSAAADGTPIAVAGVPNIPASKITSLRCDAARMPYALEDDGFTAGGAIGAKAAVYISGNNQVKEATATEAVKAIGYSKAIAVLNDPVTVIWAGRIDGVVADGAIPAGDLVTPSDATAGRVKSLSTFTGAGSAHSHSASSVSAGAHTHTNPNTQAVSGGTPAGSLDSVSAGTPAGTISSKSAGTPAGTISSDSAGTPAGTVGAEAAHTHPLSGVTSGPSTILSGADVMTDGGTLYAALNSGGSPTVAFTAASTVSWNVTLARGDHVHTKGTMGADAGSSHTHSFTGSALATHTHIFTGSALATHNHTFTGSALGTHGHTFTGSALATHSHTIDSTGSAGGHTHTISVDNEATHTHTTPVGKALGRALTAAAGAGSTFSVLLGGM